jgi:hypothetical protein
MGLADWANFFVAEVGASAALTGLVTVAISINLTRILAFEHLPGRAAESLFSLTAVFSLCAVALFPGIAPGALGGVAVALAALSLYFGVRVQMATRRMEGGPSFGRQAVGLIGRIASNAPIGVGGVLLWLHAPAGATWLAAGIVIALAVAVMNAWVLLVEIVR